MPRAGPLVSFVGAGPGAPDLLTVRGARRLAEADVVVWAASLIHPDVLALAAPGAEVLDSSRLTLEEVLAVYDRAARDGARVVRLHSGDPALYGAIQEQIEHCERAGIPYEVVPGVSALGAAAAAIRRELTVPGVAQSVVITRLPGRTAVPEWEGLRGAFSSGATIALFLSSGRPRVLQHELLAAGCSPDTPCAVVVRATWEEERVLRTSLEGLAEAMRAAGVRRTALVLAGPALGASGARSRLYDPAFSHSFRRARGGRS